MQDVHPDRESFDKIWDMLINKEIRNYGRRYGNYVKIIPNAKEEIWEKYRYLNQYCKVNYMKDPEGKIDRHKVAACYLIAICTVKPMRTERKYESDLNDDEVYFSMNEFLAIAVAFSMVRAFALAAIDASSLPDETKKEDVNRFKEGIRVPDGKLVNHGSYLNNFASELHYAAEEGKLNILSVAHELYLLEVFTRVYCDTDVE